MRSLVPALLFAALAVHAAAPRIAIRVRGTVEVSAEGSAWTELIRNRKLGEPGFIRTGPDSVGQVRESPLQVAVLGPDTLLKAIPDGLRLEKGALRGKGIGHYETRLGTVDALEADADFVLIDRGSAGMACEVYDGFVRIHPSGGPVRDADGTERASWRETGEVIVTDSSMADVPVDLRPAPDEY